MRKAADDATLHQPHQPVDSDNLHHYLHPVLEHQEPLHPAAVRLPPLSHRRRHKERHGDTRGAKGPEFETTFILEKNGQRKEFTLENYPDSTWTFIDSKTVQISEGYVPPIHDFFIQTTDGSEDLTDSVLSRRGYTFLLISPHLEYADDSNFGEIDQIYEYSQSHGYPFYGLTASTDEGIQHWRDITGAEYPFYLTDETTLKTVIRSNPGLLLLKDGVVIGKWSHNDLPQLSYQTGKLETTEYGHLPEDSVTGKISKYCCGTYFRCCCLPLPTAHGSSRSG